jgi:GMP synthase (glutamine-hydrolysing)
MKPFLILQHLDTDGPAYLAAWLRRNHVAFVVRNTQAGEPFPASIDAYGALAILGGEMSANDELPSLRQAERLFRQALDRGVPTLGHCLGGQLMARALGAVVGPSPQPEIGWQRWQVADNAEARAWFGAAPPERVYEWHYEAFALPAGAVPLACSGACAHQAFAIGPHLGMQFHVEADAGKIAFWGEDAGDDYLAGLAAQHPGRIQGVQAMRDAVALAAQQRLADHIYARWLSLASAG